jgi:hypothetical protein
MSLKDIMAGKIPGMPSKEQMDVIVSKVNEYAGFTVNALKAIGANQQSLARKLEEMEARLAARIDAISGADRIRLTEETRPDLPPDVRNDIRALEGMFEDGGPGI